MRREGIAYAPSPPSLGRGLLLLATLGSALAVAAPEEGAPPLDIHVVPHSHCDAGYKKTFAGYLGSEVNSILSSVTQALDADPSRRFIWSESSFLEGWLKHGAGEGEAELFRALVAAGQIEIVGGGWVMHDEAITTHGAQLRQMQVGHEEVLKPYLGKDFRVRHGWQIDPFGQSAFTPTLCALSGMEAWVTNRVGDANKAEMKKKKSLQFLWHGNVELSASDSEVLTHVLDSHYESPAGFDWELDPHSPGESSEPVTDANVQNMSDAYVQEALARNHYYLGESILVPFGQDFRFQNASIQFDNMGKISDFISANKPRYLEKYGRNVSIRYSTLAEYFDDLHQRKLKFPRREESSLIPLVDDGHKAWTGYYAGYPNLKKLSSEVEQLVNTAAVFHALSIFNLNRISEDVAASMMWSRRQSSIMQHHDALPATGYPFNNADYVRRLQESQRLAYHVLSKAVGGGLRGPSPEPISVSETVVTEIVVVNSLVSPQIRREMCKILVSRPDVIVTGSAGSIASQVTKMQSADGVYELQWIADAPALGFFTYELKTCTVSHWTDPPYPVPPGNCAKLSSEKIGKPGMGISNAKYRLTLEDDLSLSISSGKGGEASFRAVVSFGEYLSDSDTVYVFRGEGARQSPQMTVNAVKVLTGPITSSVELTYDNSVKLVATIATAPQDQDDLVKILVEVPPLQHGTNFVAVISSSVRSCGSNAFVNGFQREWREYDSTRLAGENYRPLVGTAWLGDDDTRMSVMSRSPLGFTSPRAGEMEVMLHRRADGPSSGNVVRGDDPSGTVQELFLHVAPASTKGARRAKLLSRQLFERLQILSESQSPPSANAFPTPLNFDTAPGSNLMAELPEEVSLLSLRFAEGPALHMQLENMFGLDEGGTTLQVPLSELMRPSATFQWNAEEMSATFITTAAEARGRRMWNAGGQRPLNKPPTSCLEVDGGVQVVTLAPKQICSLKLRLYPRGGGYTGGVAH